MTKRERPQKSCCLSTSAFYFVFKKNKKINKNFDLNKTKQFSFFIVLYTGDGVSDSAPKDGPSVVAGLLVAEVVQVADVALLQAQQTGQALHVFVSEGRNIIFRSKRCCWNPPQKITTKKHRGTAVSDWLPTSRVEQVKVLYVKVKVKVKVNFITGPYV